MRTDKQYFFDSPDAVLAAYRAMAPRVDPQLPMLFHKVPRMPYAVRSMTPAESASSTAANYQTGSLALGTSGYFTINALGYASEAKWRTETLFLHEAVPGHHMQVARAAEIEGLHPWRSQATFNIAYGEGWALYAESLGYDIGMYKDPYQHYGNLQARLFRAARLVVDTGIHAFNWPRDKAVAYMVQQGGVDQEFAESEVDRYFSNPAQALGYLLGYHKMRELRARAESALGCPLQREGLPCGRHRQRPDAACRPGKAGRRMDCQRGRAFHVGHVRQANQRLCNGSSVAPSSVWNSCAGTGWVETKWRSDMVKPAKNTICLWYDRDAEEAARFYAKTFPDSSVGAVHLAPGDFPSGKKGDVLTVEFNVMGIPCLGLNGGPAFKQSEAFSFQVSTADQAETDRYWSAIVGNGGQESACGWCKDKWGLNWQITPVALIEAITDPDPAAAKRAFDAMMEMGKIDIAKIEAARRG